MKTTSYLFLFPCLFLAVLLPSLAFCQDIPIAVGFATQDSRILANISLNIPTDYHAYSHNPGESGKPTTLKFILEGIGPASILYPKGTEERDIYDANTNVRVYKGETTLLAILPAAAASKTYSAELDLLLCSNRHCLPVKQHFTGQIPDKNPLLSAVPWQREANMLLEMQQEAVHSLEEGTAPPPRSGVEDSVTKNADSENAKGQLAPAAPIADTPGSTLNLEPRFARESTEVYSLGKALLLGLIAGLILNAMPCVLPVLTLKLSGILLMGDMQDKIKLRQFRSHNICFALGVMTLFTVLALLLGMADLIWGQLFQSEILLLIMLLLVFLMGLSMLGVFTLPAFDLHFDQSCKNPLLSSYLTGMVSTFLATPCSGPLLGGVLAWAFLQSLPVLMAVFWSVGAGMALPYIIFSIWPQFANILPRPGAWMQIFERILGFLLLATALYLLSILPQDKHIQILCVLLLASFTAWFWGKFCDITAPPVRRRAGSILSLGLIAIAFFWIIQPPAPTPSWTSFTAEKFSASLGHKAMLVEFTADWCPNCKFLEATVLNEETLKQLQKIYDFELVRVDLTQPSPYAEKLLTALGSRSIPLTALFPKGELAHKPLVLRDIYTADTLKQAAQDTFAPS